ncbi:MAG: molybdopterin-dependent oxidoreductase [Proteobacteria bacterium]|nr:molybdopterin-dependent oxidoreductase [Pseudomonadota bacterium]
MDLDARELGHSPVTLRENNIIRSASMTYTTKLGEVFDRGNFHQVMQSAVSKMDWDGFGKRKQPQKNAVCCGDAEWPVTLSGREEN